MGLLIIPITLKEANEFVENHHRHHKPVVGHKFSIGVEKDGQLRGVCIVGRPVARNVNDKELVEDCGWVLEEGCDFCDKYELGVTRRS